MPFLLTEKNIERIKILILDIRNILHIRVKISEMSLCIKRWLRIGLNLGILLWSFSKIIHESSQETKLKIDNL